MGEGLPTEVITIVGTPFTEIDHFMCIFLYLNDDHIESRLKIVFVFLKGPARVAKMKIYIF